MITALNCGYRDADDYYERASAALDLARRFSGSETRHPIGVASVGPIASGPDYPTDVARAQHFEALVQSGHAGSLIEAALRFVISNDAMTTVLVGTSTIAQLETAAAAIDKGPLPSAALDQLPGLWRTLAAPRSRQV